MKKSEKKINFTVIVSVSLSIIKYGHGLEIKITQSRDIDHHFVRLVVTGENLTLFIFP